MTFLLESLNNCTLKQQFATGVFQVTHIYFLPNKLTAALKLPIGQKWAIRCGKYPVVRTSEHLTVHFQLETGIRTAFLESGQGRQYLV